jgi:hypothetical protein
MEEALVERVHQEHGPGPKLPDPWHVKAKAHPDLFNEFADLCIKPSMEGAVRIGERWAQREADGSSEPLAHPPPIPPKGLLKLSH